MIWISLPVVVVSYFARAYLARLIYSNYQSQIALIFGFLAGAILFRVIYNILSRYFYAYKDTVTPLIVSLFTIALNIYLAYTLSKATSYGAAGLAIAQAIAAATESIILGVIIYIKDPKMFNAAFLDALFRMFSATGFAIVAAYIMVSLLPLQVDDKGFIVLGVKFGVISLVTISVYVMTSFMLRLEEPKPVIKRIVNLVLKPVRIQW